MKRMVLLALLAMAVCGSGAQAQRRDARTVRAVFIGNSITEGALHAQKERTAPPVAAAEYIGRMMSADVDFRNCGRSGATTVDFLPARGADFVRVERAIAELMERGSGPIVFSVMLGTNDSASSGPTGSPVSDEEYGRNLTAMMDRIRELCPDALFVLHRPVWYSPNTYNGAVYLAAGLKRLEGYAGVLAELAERYDDVYTGDRDGFDFFRDRHEKYCFPEEGNAGVFYLHPNEKGARRLGKMWARAVVEAMEASGRY